MQAQHVAATETDFAEFGRHLAFTLYELIAVPSIKIYVGLLLYISLSSSQRRALIMSETPNVGPDVNIGESAESSFPSCPLIHSKVAQRWLLFGP